MSTDRKNPIRPKTLALAGAIVTSGFVALALLPNARAQQGSTETGGTTEAPAAELPAAAAPVPAPAAQPEAAAAAQVPEPAAILAPATTSAPEPAASSAGAAATGAAPDGTGAIPQPSVTGERAADDDRWLEMRYHGELFDDQQKAISGVFPMNFTIYRAEGSSEAIWTEAHFVAVLEGEYDIWLGSQSSLPLNLENKMVNLAVTLPDGASVWRGNLRLTASEDRNQVPELGWSAEAQLAARALTADRAGLAANCRTLGGKPVESLDKYAELHGTIQELLERVRGGGGNRIGSQTVNAARQGPPNGVPYDLTCPPGFAMTGMRGESKPLPGQPNIIMVGSFRPICTEVL